MSDLIAERPDGERFSVKSIYSFGSPKNVTAGLGGDIDLLIHDSADPERRQDLEK